MDQYIDTDMLQENLKNECSKKMGVVGKFFHMGTQNTYHFLKDYMFEK